MVKITITGSDPATGGLTFDGDKLKGDREVKHKDEVEWHLKQGCGVKAILSIFVKPSPPAPPSVNIWDIQPHKAAQSTNWKGKVNETAPDQSEWHYSIRWEDMNGNPHTYDPKIIVNTKMP